MNLKEFLTEKAKDRSILSDDSRRRYVSHTNTMKEHAAAATHLRKSIDHLLEAAKSVPNEDQMHHIINLVKDHNKSVSTLLNAHINAAKAHQAAATEHKHVYEVYNGNKDAHNDAMVLSRAAEQASKDANKAHK